MEFEEIHLAILAATALVILYSDHQGYLYFRGKKPVLRENFIRWSHRLVWIGLVGMVLTGVSMVIPQWEYFLADPVFYVKMGMVAVLAVNAIAIGTLSPVATTTPFAALPREQRNTLIFSGTLSALGWISAALIGFFFL